jgi:hypothetical protein
MHLISGFTVVLGALPRPQLPLFCPSFGQNPSLYLGSQSGLTDRQKNFA